MHDLTQLYNFKRWLVLLFSFYSWSSKNYHLRLYKCHFLRLTTIVFYLPMSLQVPVPKVTHVLISLYLQFKVGFGGRLNEIKWGTNIKNVIFCLRIECIQQIVVHLYLHLSQIRRRKWQPTPIFLPRISHEQSSLSKRVGHNLATECMSKINWF